VQPGPLAGFDCKRQAILPSATGKLACGLEKFGQHCYMAMEIPVDESRFEK